MGRNKEALLQRLAQLAPEERKRVLNAFLASAIVVNHGVGKQEQQFTGAPIFRIKQEAEKNKKY